MRLTNGSWLANALLFGTGALCGVIGYRVIHSSVNTEPERSVAAAREEASDRSEFLSPGVNRSDRPSRTGRASLEDDLKAAFATVDPDERASFFRQAGADGARNDLKAALEMGVSIKRLQDRVDFHRGLFGVWSEVDPESALAHAKRNFNPGLMQSELIGLVVNKWAADDPQDARVWTEQNLSGPLREQALTDLMVGWTRRNPDLASKWVIESRSATQPLLSAVGTTWAEQEPKEAAEWAMDIPYASSRRAAAVAVAVEWARQDPQEAAEFFSEVASASEPEGLDLATVIADVWGTSDPASTAEWVATLPDGAIRDQAAGTLATVWATRDIEAAVQWAATIGDDSMRGQVIAHLGTTWGALEPDRAIEWLAELPLEEAQAGLKGAFNSWGAVDRGGMQDWVENAEPSDVVDQARRSLADVVSQDDILSAIDLSMGISDTTARNDAVARYYRHWRKIDDASAQEWINEVWREAPSDLKDRLAREQKAIVIPRE